MSVTQAKVDDTTAEYDAMLPAWQMIDALCGGTASMRAAGADYLPTFAIEREEWLNGGEADYQARINRAFLFNGTRDAIDDAASKPFAKPVTITGGLPDQLSEIEANADLEGSTLTDLAAAVFRDAVAHGLSFLLVDYSVAGDVDDRLEEKKQALRPYFTHIKARDLFAIRHRRTAGGGREIVQIRYREVDHESDGGDFGNCLVEVIRVITASIGGVPGTVRVFKRREGQQEYVEDTDAAAPYLLPSIALEPLYTRQTGFMAAMPYFEDLAWMNVDHWQKTSQLNGILAVQSFALLVGYGVPKEQVPKNMPLAATRVLMFSEQKEEGVGLEYIEHSGSGTKTLIEKMDRLEANMVQLGQQPNVELSKNQTATGASLHADSEETVAESWARSLRELLVKCFQHGADLAQVALPQDFDISIHSQADRRMHREDAGSVLMQMRTAGNPQISHDRLIVEQQELGYLGRDTDPAEERRKIRAEEAELDEIPDDVDPDGDAA